MAPHKHNLPGPMPIHVPIRNPIPNPKDWDVVVAAVTHHGRSFEHGAVLGLGDLGLGLGDLGLGI